MYVYESNLKYKDVHIKSIETQTYISSYYKNNNREICKSQVLPESPIY